MGRIIRGILSIFLALVLSLGIYIVYYNNTKLDKQIKYNVRDGLLKNEENILKAKASLEKQLKLMIGKIANSQAIIRYE